MERIFDSPRRVRFVAANVAASDTVKGSHIQRNPLSMGALAEPEEWPRVSQSPKEKKRRDCVMTARLTLSGMQQRKLAHSCEVGSYSTSKAARLAWQGMCAMIRSTAARIWARSSRLM